MGRCALLRVFSTLIGLLAALAGCGGDSSSRVKIKVDTRPDSQAPNLVVRVDVFDDDHPPPPPGPPPPPSASSALAASASVARADDAGEEETADDSTRLAFVGDSGLFALELPGAPVALPAPRDPVDPDWGPPLLLQIDGELRRASAVAVAGTEPGAAPHAPRDVFLVLLDADNQPLRLQNLTRTPGVDEIQAAWSPEGSRLAVLQSSIAGSQEPGVVVYALELRADPELRGVLHGAGALLWRAEPGQAARGLVWGGRSEQLGVEARGDDGTWEPRCLETGLTPGPPLC
jgi:hypothetical protein